MSLNITKNNVRQLVKDAWWEGVNAVTGYHLVTQALSRDHYSPITHVLAMGKAACSMMSGAVEVLPDEIKGLVITKYNHLNPSLVNNRNIELIESGHPIPDENSLLAGESAIHFVQELTEKDNLLVLLSGGASALLEQLDNNMTLVELKKLNDAMLASQKSICEINSIRSDLSLIKGGKLLNQCNCQSITVMAISDVEGDDIRVIGSGIGVCDLSNSTTQVIGTNAIARKAAGEYLSSQQISVNVNEQTLYGDLYRVAQRVSQTIIDGNSGAYIYGGEPVIELPEVVGIGGRNQSLALAIAIHIQNEPGIVTLVAGTDGTDGPTLAAGGIIDGQTFSKQKTAQKDLISANAGAYLEAIGDLFVSGPTGTNVMDIVVAIKY